MSDPLPTNPAFSFVEKQLSLLGDRDPLEVLAATPHRLAEIFHRNEPEMLVHRPAPGVWSACEILGHLADTEWIFGFRIRTILCDETPTLMAVDQERWVAAQGHRQRSAEELLATFSALRHLNVGFWRSLSEEELGRAGYHSEAGVEMSLGFLRRLQAGHDLNHLGQLAERLPPPPEEGG